MSNIFLSITPFPWGGFASRSREAARAQADLELQIAQLNLRTAEQQLLSGAAQLYLQARTANNALVAAEKTLKIVTEQAQNERQRFTLGSSTPLEVQVAEEALVQSQLRVTKAQVDFIKASLSLEHTTGELLKRYPETRKLTQ